MKGIIYARQSSGGNEQSLSIDVQIENCKKYAEKNNITIIGTYTDYNTSGRCFPIGAESIAERDLAFQKWFNEKTVGSKKFRTGLGEVFQRLDEVDVIVIDDITRLYRPLSASFLESFIHQSLTINNIKLHAVKGGIISPDSFADSLMLSIQNQIESQAILIRTKKSKAAYKKLKDDGFVCCGKTTLFGYRYLGKQKYEIIEDEARVVKKIYEKLLKGDSYNKIAIYINNIFHSANRKLFVSGRIKEIVVKPEYCGMSYNSNGDLIDSKCFGDIPLVTKSEWFKVQEITKNRRRGTWERKETYTVTGLLRCSTCGKHLFVRHVNMYRYYYCSDMVSGGYHHYIRYSSEKNVFSFNEVKDNIFGMSCNGNSIGLYEVTFPLALNALINEFKLKQTSSELEGELLKTKDELDKLSRHEQRLSKMLFEGLMDEEQFTTMVKSFKHQRVELRKKIDTLTKDMYNANETGNEDLFKEFILGEATDEQIKLLLGKVVDELVIFDDKMVIKMKDKKSFEVPIMKSTPDSMGRMKRTFPEWNAVGNLNGEAVIAYQTGIESELYENNGLKIITI